MNITDTERAIKASLIAELKNDLHELVLDVAFRFVDELIYSNEHALIEMCESLMGISDVADDYLHKRISLYKWLIKNEGA